MDQHKSIPNSPTSLERAKMNTKEFNELPIADKKALQKEAFNQRMSIEVFLEQADDSLVNQILMEDIYANEEISQ